MIHLRFRHEILILHISCTIKSSHSFSLLFNNIHRKAKSEWRRNKDKSNHSQKYHFPTPLPSLANNIHPEVVWVRHSRAHRGASRLAYSFVHIFPLYKERNVEIKHLYKNKKNCENNVEKNLLSSKNKVEHIKTIEDELWKKLHLCRLIQLEKKP